MDGHVHEYSSPGFRFWPTEEELVSFYLRNKLNGMRTDIDRIIPVVDIYNYNPWDLGQFAGELCPPDNEQWFFFSLRQEREARGGRPNRLTAEGYWKATGSPGEVYSSHDHRVIGRKKTMVFYMGRAPYGIKTEWKMNEYKAFDHHSINDDEASSISSSSHHAANPMITREELSLCRIYRSRSLRSFDRRPPPEAVVIGQQVAVHHQPEPEAREYNHNQEQPNGVPESTINNYNISPEGSLISAPGAINNTNPPPSAENSDSCDMGTHDFNQPLWDWEHCFEF